MRLELNILRISSLTNPQHLGLSHRVSCVFLYYYTTSASKALTTMECNNKVDLLHLTCSIHGNVIASSTHYGYIRHSKPLSVYIIEKLPGITYMESCIMNGINVILSPKEYQRQKKHYYGLCAVLQILSISNNINQLMSQLLCYILEKPIANGRSPYPRYLYQ